MTPSAKGFTACGQFYPMSEPPKEGYPEYCYRIMLEIKTNANKSKSAKK